MQTIFSCTVFLPGKSQGVGGLAEVSSTAMSVSWDDGRVVFPYHSLSAQKGGYNNQMLVLSGTHEGQPHSFYFDSNAIAQAMSGYRLPPGFATQLGRAAPGGSAFRGVLPWVMVGLAILAGLYMAMVALSERAVDFAVEQIPIDLETELGKAAAGQQLGDMQVCSAAPVNQAVAEIGERLIAGLGATPYTYRFKVVDIPDVNAFALPGGYIFIHWGLIETAETADQVAGVLAHEIQHAVARHGLRNVIARASIGLLAGLVFGDLQGVGGLIAGGAGELAALSFSREQEDEADRLGLELLYAANFDPEGMPQFFARLEEEQASKGLDLPSFMSTHPDTKARIGALEAAIQAQGKGDIKALSVTWSAVKEAGCLPVRHADPDKPVTKGTTP
jgi:Zn-dependent protease with chaperone function